MVGALVGRAGRRAPRRRFQDGFSHCVPSFFITSGAAPAKNSSMNTSTVTTMYGTKRFSMLMCMKFFATR